MRTMTVEELVRELEGLEQPGARVEVTGMIDYAGGEAGLQAVRLKVVAVRSELGKVVLEGRE